MSKTSPREGRVASATFALMFGTSFVINLAVSIIAPMLPGHLSERKLLPHGSEGGLVQGMLFSISSLSSLLITPLAPRMSNAIGRSAMCGIGIMLFAFGTLSFGTTHWLVAVAFQDSDAAPSLHPNIELSLLFSFRVIAAVGGTLASLSSMFLALSAQPDNRGTIVGASETAIGLGFSVGPPFGAAFFSAGGFAAPFAAATLMACGLLPLLMIAIQASQAAAVAQEEDNPEEAPTTDVGSRHFAPWHSVSAWSSGMVGMLSLFGLGFLDPTLAPFEMHLLGASTSGVGVLFAAMAFPYAMFGTVIGAVVDRSHYSGPPLMCFGLAALGLTFLALPPQELFMATWAWQIVMLLFVGFLCACAMVPAIPVTVSIVKKEARKRGLPAVDEDSVVSFIYFGFTFGEMLGPLLGSVLVETFNFSYATQGIAATMLLTAVVTSLVFTLGGHCLQHRIDSTNSIEETLLTRTRTASDVMPTPTHGASSERRALALGIPVA